MPLSHLNYNQVVNLAEKTHLSDEDEPAEIDSSLHDFVRWPLKTIPMYNILRQLEVDLTFKFMPSKRIKLRFGIVLLQT